MAENAAVEISNPMPVRGLYLREFATRVSQADKGCVDKSLIRKNDEGGS